MQDCELYGRILGIAAPWRVERVELQLKQGEVHVYLGETSEDGIREKPFSKEPTRAASDRDAAMIYTASHDAGKN